MLKIFSVHFENLKKPNVVSQQTILNGMTSFMRILESRDLTTLNLLTLSDNQDPHAAVQRLFCNATASSSSIRSPALLDDVVGRHSFVTLSAHPIEYSH